MLTTSAFVVRRFLPALFLSLLLSESVKSENIEPVLQDISPGWQSVTGQKFTYINRGEFIDIYDNKSRVLFRSIQVSMDEGAGKGSAYRFAVSADEKYVQATIWVKFIGDMLSTYEVASGKRVEMDRISGQESGGSAEDFNKDPILLPVGVDPQSVSRFLTAPEQFFDRSSFLTNEKSGDQAYRLVEISLLRCDRRIARNLNAEAMTTSPSFSLDLHSREANPIRSFPLTQILPLIQQGTVRAAGGIDDSNADLMEILCTVDSSGAPRTVVSSPYEISQVFVKDLVATKSGSMSALAWDVYPGKPSLLNGIEVYSLADGSLYFRDESLWADCLSFSKEENILYVVGRFGHDVGPLSDIKERSLAKIRMTQNGSELLWHRPVATMVDLSLAPDESWIYTVADDGRLHLFDASSGNDLVQVAGYEENGLLISNSDHFFMASGGASEAVALRRGGRAYPLEQFDLHFNRPQLLLQQLEASTKEIEAAELAYSDRLLLHGISETSFNGFESLPEVSATAGTQEGSQLQITIDAKSADSDLVSLSAWVNNVPVFGKAGGKLSNRRVTGQVKIPVLSGRNKIQLSVMDAQGRESIKETLSYQSSASPPPVVARILTIGVSDYPGSDFDLDYAAKDARDLLTALSSKMGAQIEVKTKLLVDTAATKAGIQAAKSFFAEGNPDDLAIVFLAGHGVLNPGDNRYYFCPADTDFNDFALNGVSYEDIENLVDQIPAMRRVILIDSCHSGELTETELRSLEKSVAETTAGAGGQVRALRVIGSRSTGGGGPSRQTMRNSQFGFQDFRRQVGAQVLSSAGPLELALEGNGYENGVFTFYLLSALNEKDTDRNQDGALTVSELFTRAADQVIEVTEGLQHPRFRHENRAFDFALVGNAAPSPKAASPTSLLPGLTFDLSNIPTLESLAGRGMADMTGRKYPELSLKVISAEEAGALSLSQIRYAINELYGVYGYPFENSSASEIRKHFSQFPWFKPVAGLKMEEIDTRMTATEKRNIEILAEARKTKQEN